MLKLHKKILIDLLKTNRVAHESLWIINAIAIKQGSKQLLETLTKRPEIESLTFDEKYEIFDEPTVDVTEQKKSCRMALRIC